MSKVNLLCGGPLGAVQCSASVILISILYWFDVRPYGILSIVALLFLTVGAKTTTVNSFTCPTFTDKYSTQIRKFRSEHPGKFCAFSSAVFIFVAILGNIVPGQCLYTLCLCTTVIFAVKNLLPPNIIQVWKQPLICTYNDSEVEEFLPELNDHNIDLLNLAQGAELKSDSDVESDKISDALLLDKTPNLSASSSDSGEDVAPADEIEFKSGYFNGDSSTDDDSYTQGLIFKDKSIDVTDIPVSKAIPPKILDAATELKQNAQQKLVSGWMSYVSDIVSRGMVSAMKPASTSSQTSVTTAVNRKKDSDSDSEFELIYSDDLNNS